MTLGNHPHRRYNALTGDWLLVSPHRNRRPWQGSQEPTASPPRPSHDPTCYLCPGNTRANGEHNPSYSSTFVFTNDFAALLPDEAQEALEASSELFQAQAVRGTCRVICFSPRHDLTLAEMSSAELASVITLWVDQLQDLGQHYIWVQLFENKGALMGCSNPHPHGQIWASDTLPNEITKEDRQQARYYARHSVPLLLDYAAQELTQQERVVLVNDDWVVLVPYWAYWPFETMILPKKRHILRLTDCTDAEKQSLADILGKLLRKYDNLFETSFPYSFGWHNAPFQPNVTHWQLHAHLYPPLLRSATVKKFTAAYELLAELQRDTTPEQAAERLRALSDIHYKEL